MLRIRQCSPKLPLSCQGGNNTETQCADGHMNPMCAICQEGWTMNDFAGACTLCAGGGGGGKALIGGVFFLIERLTVR